MKKALVLIDYIYDFVEDDGALTAGKPAQAIANNIAEAINTLTEYDVLIIANDCHSIDDKTSDHPESKLFPPHAIEGTKGRDNMLQDDIDKSRAQVIYLDKTRYSAFYNTGLNDILDLNNVDKLYLAGVCTDICVLHTAVDAYNYGFETVILSDCVASFDQAGHEFALNHFKNTLGMELASSIE